MHQVVVAPRGRWESLLVVCALCIGAPPLRAQPPLRAPGVYVYEYDVSDRWLTTRQQPRFMPFREVKSWVHIDVRQVDSVSRRMTLRLFFEPALRADTAALTVASDGRIASAFVHGRTLSAIPNFPTDTVDLRTSNYFEDPPLSGGIFYAPRLALPATRVWEFVPVVRAERLERGARWVDTLNLSTAADGFTQTLTGVRTSVVRGDTTISGRQLWIIDDSARVHATDRMLDDEPISGARVTIERNTDGIVRGRYLLDATLGLWTTRSDIASLAGTATLRYTDGRAFTTPVRFERRRTWTLYAHDAFLARQAEIRADRARGRGGMVIVPVTEFQTRLTNGDRALRDSLLGAWDRAQNPNERQQLYSLLYSWGARGDTTLRSVLDAKAIAAGDTIYWLDALTRTVTPSRWDVRTVRDVMIPLMTDPATTWALGISRERFIPAAMAAVFKTLPAITPDTAQWSLTPAVYDYFAQLRTTSANPLLRDLGLASLFVRDPRRWGDTVLAAAGPANRMLTQAVYLARGVAASGLTQSKAPMPPTGAAWREWLEWMVGRSRDYVPPTSIPIRPPEIQFGAGHANVVRFYSVRANRDVIGEIRSNLAAASEDSARIVFSTMLAGLGDLTVTPESIVAQLLSGSPAQVTSARRTLSAIFADASRGTGVMSFGSMLSVPVKVQGGVAVVDSVLTGALIDRWLTAMFALEAPWPQLEDRAPPAAAAALRPLPQPPRAPPAINLPPITAPTPPQHLTMSSANVPANIRAKWQDRVTFLTPAEWRAENQREASTMYTAGKVLRAGPFLLVGFDHTSRSPRSPDQAPALYAGGTSYYLMEFNGEWVIISSGTWIT